MVYTVIHFKYRFTRPHGKAEETSKDAHGWWNRTAAVTKQTIFTLISFVRATSYVEDFLPKAMVIFLSENRYFAEYCISLRCGRFADTNGTSHQIFFSYTGGGNPKQWP